MPLVSMIKYLNNSVYQPFSRVMNQDETWYETAYILGYIVYFVYQNILIEEISQTMFLS